MLRRFCNFPAKNIVDPGADRYVMAKKRSGSVMGYLTEKNEDYIGAICNIKTGEVEFIEE